MIRTVSGALLGTLMGGLLMAQDSITVFTKYYPASTSYSLRKWQSKLMQLADSSFILVSHSNGKIYAVHTNSEGTPLHFHVYDKPMGMIGRLHLTNSGDLYFFVGQPDGYIIRLKLDPVQGFDTLWQKQYRQNNRFLNFYEFGQSLITQGKIYVVSYAIINSVKKPLVMILDTIGNILKVWVDMSANDASDGGSIAMHPDGDLVVSYRVASNQFVVVKVSSDFQQVKWSRVITDEAFPYITIDPQTGYIWSLSAGWNGQVDILVFDANGTLKISQAYKGLSLGDVVFKTIFDNDKVIIQSSNLVYVLSRSDASLLQSAYVGTNNVNDPEGISDFIITRDSGFAFVGNDANWRFVLVKANRFFEDGQCNWVVIDTPMIRQATSFQIYSPSFVDSTASFSAVDVPMATPTQNLPLDSSYCPPTTVPNSIVNSVMKIDDNEVRIYPVEGGIFVDPETRIDLLSVYTINGKSVKHLTNVSESRFISLLPGMYIIAITDEEGLRTKKIIVF